MPRRRRTFIDRSRAKTFQLVHGANNSPSEHVFVPEAGLDVNTTGEGEPSFPFQEGAIPVSDFQDTYDKRRHEVGEYGFADDEYDYPKHFRTIGGTGGVYMDAVSGMPKPEAVASSSASKNSRKPTFLKEQILLRDSFAGDEKERVSSRETWQAPEDVQRSQQAIDAIRRDRKGNKDLDEVIAALDTDGELELTASRFEDDSVTDALDDIIRDTISEDSGFLEDDFVAVANDDNEKGDAGFELLDGVVEDYREPRLLDAQFDKFMQGFDMDDTDDEEEEELRAELMEHKERLEEISPHLTGGEFQDLWNDDELLQDLSSLQIEVAEEGDGEEPDGDGENCEGGHHADGSSRSKEFNEFRSAEFERGMTGLLDSYKRVSADEAFAALEGLRGARDAIGRAEEEEKALVELQNDARLDDIDGHDSELDSQFDEMFTDKRERWDCETIISTYSNLDNHPSVIDAPASRKRRTVKAEPIIRLDPRTQAPTEFLSTSSSAGPSAETVDYGSRRDRSTNNARAKDETKEEKRARKAAVKEVARERRALKSEMRKAFGAENVKQSKHATALGTSKVALKF